MPTGPPPMMMTGAAVSPTSRVTGQVSTICSIAVPHFAALRLEGHVRFRRVLREYLQPIRRFGCDDIAAPRVVGGRAVDPRRRRSRIAQRHRGVEKPPARPYHGAV